MNVDGPLYRTGIRQLCQNYNIPDGTATGDRMTAYGVVCQAAWVTDAVFQLAVDDCLAYCPPPMPPASEFRRILDDARRELEHEATARAALQAARLPAPAPSSQSWFHRTPKDELWRVFADNFVLGKARQRRRNRAMAAYRAKHGLPRTAGLPVSVALGAGGAGEPTAEEVAAVRAEMEADEWWRKRVVPAAIRPTGAAR